MDTAPLVMLVAGSLLLIGLLAVWAGRRLVGAVLLGLGLGVPAAYLSGRIQPGEPILEEALGIVLVCAGLGIWLHVSFLLASIVLGMT